MSHDFAFPGTTLDKIEIPLDDGSYIYDTPGIIHRHQMAHYLTAKTSSMSALKKEIKPKTYQLNPEQTLFLGGLGRFDFISGEKQGFTAFFDNELKLHRTKLEGASAFYDKHLGTLLTPPNSKEKRRFSKTSPTCIYHQGQDRPSHLRTRLDPRNRHRQSRRLGTRRRRRRHTKSNYLNTERKELSGFERALRAYNEYFFAVVSVGTRSCTNKGKFETLGSNFSHESPKDFADVRHHFRKVLKETLLRNYVINIKTTCLPQQPGTHPQTHHPNRKNGLNDQIKTSVRQALDARELIKVTLLQNTDENIHEVAEILEEEIGVDTVQKIGRILILFKQSSKKENRKISKKVKEI